MLRKIDRTHMDGIISLTGATLVYGFFGIISRYVGYNLPIFYQNWSRELLAALLLILVLRSFMRIRKPDWKWIITRSLSGVGAFLLYFISINAMNIGLTYFIFYSGLVVSGFVLGTFMFRERVTPIRGVSLSLAILGLLCIYGLSADTPNVTYALAAFTSGVLSTIWNIVTKKLSAYPAVQLTFLDNALTIPVYLILSLAAREPWPVTEVSWVQGASLLIGVLFVITGLLVIRGFQKLDAQTGSLVMLSEVVFAIILGYIFFGESLSTNTAIGGMLIVSAMILPELNPRALAGAVSYAHRRKSNR